MTKRLASHFITFLKVFKRHMAVGTLKTSRVVFWVPNRWQISYSGRRKKQSASKIASFALYLKVHFHNKILKAKQKSAWLDTSLIFSS